MATLPPDEYLRLKGFLAVWDELVLPGPNSDLPPDKRPVAALEWLENFSMAKARVGLLQAVNDIVEMSLPWKSAQVAEMDQQLRDRGAPTLTEVRARHAKRLALLIKRGSIHNDTDYYLAKGVLDGATEALSPEVEARLAELVATYEEGGERA
jgi:hypothetical protein